MLIDSRKRLTISDHSIMPIQETLEFSSDEFLQVVTKASTEWLRQQEVIAIRKQALSGSGAGVGVTDAINTGDLSALSALYRSRSLYVADRKLELIRAELGRRNIDSHKPSKSKDLLGPIAIGSVGVIAGAKIGDLVDGTTTIEQMGAGVSDGASPRTGLLDKPAEVAHGAGGTVEQLVDSSTGDTGTAAAIATADTTACHAGMVQTETFAQEISQTAAEKLLFSPGEPTPECHQCIGVDILWCDQCEAHIEQGLYWRTYPSIASCVLCYLVFSDSQPHRLL